MQKHFEVWIYAGLRNSIIIYFKSVGNYRKTRDKSDSEFIPSHVF